jgi:hypothetical protein
MDGKRQTHQQRLASGTEGGVKPWPPRPEEPNRPWR